MRALNYGHGAFLSAAASGHMAAMKELLGRGEMYNLDEAAFVAAQTGQVDVLELLWDHGANFEKRQSVRRENKFVSRNRHFLGVAGGLYVSIYSSIQRPRGCSEASSKIWHLPRGTERRK